ncbi:MAG: cytochrome C oxidase subunit IV family protein [Comamonadaceae bacterium]|nr:cytochrome C oxidase subunit IV family protein [Comamonadaceae bacterium]
MKLSRIDLVWIVLVTATGVTFAVGESGSVGGGAGWPVLLVYALAVVKGLAVALEFMALREAPALWRGVVVGWLLAVVALVLMAAWLAGVVTLPPPR